MHRSSVDFPKPQDMSEVPFSWILEQAEYNCISPHGVFAFASPYNAPSSTEKIIVAYGGRVGKLIGKLNGIGWYMYITLKSITSQSCSLALEVERIPTDIERSIELRIGAYDMRNCICLKSRIFEKKLRNGVKSACLAEDFNLSFVSPATSIRDIRLHGEIFLPFSSGPISHPSNHMSAPTFLYANRSNETFVALDKLSGDLSKVFNDKSTSDVAFKCELETFYAHKLILASRSPYFEGMFKSDMTENNSGIVNITDMCAESLRAMLLYIYTGKVEKFTVLTACEGLYASEKYQMPEMKQACATYLKSSLSNDVVLDVLKCANLCDDDLKEFVIGYIGKHFSVLESSEVWKEFEKENPSLTIEVLKKVVKFTIPK